MIVTRRPRQPGAGLAAGAEVWPFGGAVGSLVAGGGVPGACGASQVETVVGVMSVGATTDGVTVVGVTTVGVTTVGVTTVGVTTVGATTVGEMMVGVTAVDETAVGETHAGIWASH